MSDLYETLGSRLRAARLGFGYLPSVKLYLKVQDVESWPGTDDPFRLIAASKDTLPSRAQKDLHRVWWSTKSDREGLANEFGEVVRRTLAPSSVGPIRLRAMVSWIMDGDTGGFVAWTEAA